jgi:hypothetical protein
VPRHRKRRGRGAGHHGSFGALRGGHCRFGRQRADRVDLRIEPLDCCKVGLQQFGRADGFAANEACELHRRAPVQFIGKAHRIGSSTNRSVIRFWRVPDA